MVDHGLQEGSGEHTSRVVAQMAALGADETASIRVTVDPGPAGIDGYLWIKDPGASDGPCHGGPPAGRDWPKYAAALASVRPDIELGFAYRGRTLAESYGTGDELFSNWWKLGDRPARDLRKVLGEFAPDIVNSHNLPDSLTLLAILLSHEMGHYVFARIHRVDTTLPFDITAT